MCSAFGVSRAVEFLQQDEPHSATEGLTSRLTQLNERMVAMWMTGQDPQGLQVEADQIEDRIRDRRRRYHIGVLKHDYVNGVRRHPEALLISDAQYIASVLAGSRAALQVTFAGEDGHGGGVTRGFYVAVSEELQSRQFNKSAATSGLDPLPPLAVETGSTEIYGPSDLELLVRAGDLIVVRPPIASDVDGVNGEAAEGEAKDETKGAVEVDGDDKAAPANGAAGATAGATTGDASASASDTPDVLISPVVRYEVAERPHGRYARHDDKSAAAFGLVRCWALSIRFLQRACEQWGCVEPRLCADPGRGLGRTHRAGREDPSSDRGSPWE